MYTLTRKLSVVCLTVVLSFLVYGCGGSSKQALITDVSTDMVTASLIPDPGTYTIQPGGTANAGDVTFACPAGGPSCEVTVADDGTITSAPGSAPGMATAMDSASAIARLAAEEAASDALAAQMAAEAAERDALAAQMAAETEASDALAAQMAAETEASDALAAQMAAETEASDALAAQMAAEAEASDALAAQMAAETEASDALAAQMAAETEASDALAAQMAAETEASDALALQMAAEAEAMLDETARLAAEAAARDALAAQMAAETAASDALALKMAAETAVSDALAAQMAAETAASDALALKMAAETAASDALAAQMAAETAASDALAAQMAAETVASDALAAQMAAETVASDALAAQQVAEEEARLLTTVTAIEPELAADFARVATTDIYKVEPGHTKTVPNSDVKIYCPAEGGGIRCTVVIAVNEAGMVTYTSLGGVATIVNTDDALHTKMAIALFSPDDEGVLRDAGGLNAQLAGGVDAPPVDNMIGVERSVDGRTTTFTLIHNMDATNAGYEEDNKYTSDEPVDIGHGITNWIGRTLKRDNGDEDSTATREDEGTFYTNIMKAGAGKWKVSGMEVSRATYVFVIDPDQVISTEDGATFTGNYVTEDGDIPGTYTCVRTNDEVCNDPGTPETSLETGNLILATDLDQYWQFESDNNVKKGNIADKDYMYFGYWLQMPVKQSDSDTAESYEFRVYSGGTGANANVFSVAPTLLDGLDGYTAVFKGGAAGRYVTRDLEWVWVRVK